MNYPYRLNIRNEVLYMEEQTIKDDEAPDEVAKQAKRLREESSEEWRLSVIEQLALVTGYNRSAYQYKSNAQLKEELKRLYE